MYSRVRTGTKGRDYTSPLEWLVSSGMVYESRMVENPVVPLPAQVKPGHFKLYLNDPGLLRSALGIHASTIVLDHDFAYKGVLAENYVAGQLAAIETPLCYWKSENTAEVDFLISDHADAIVPIEVKAGKRVDSPSLRVYQARYQPPLSIRFSTRNFGFDNGIKSVPLYAVFCLGKPPM
jgi:predicted AAA+ superfamily ATPase